MLSSRKKRWRLSQRNRSRRFLPNKRRQWPRCSTGHTRNDSEAGTLARLRELRRCWQGRKKATLAELAATPNSEQRAASVENRAALDSGDGAGSAVGMTTMETPSVGTAPRAVRACSSSVAGLGVFLGSFWGLFVSFGAATGFREIHGALAIVLLGVISLGATIVTVLAVRWVAHLLRHRSSVAHVVVIILGLLLCWLAAPSPFSYAA
jgi:hypothetical protein